MSIYYATINEILCQEIIIQGYIMAKINCFDKHSQEYEDWFEIHNSLYKEELHIIKRLIGDAKNGLEIGVGTGRFFIAPNIAIGIEPSAPMREMALSKGFNVIEAIAENLPFKNEEFDFAIMMTTICFVDDPLKALQEAFRVLKDGGFLIIGFIDKDSKVGKQYEENKRKSKFYANAKFYSANEITKLCKSAGFGDVSKHPCKESDNPITFLKFLKK